MSLQAQPWENTRELTTRSYFARRSRRQIFLFLCLLLVCKVHSSVTGFQTAREREKSIQCFSTCSALVFWKKNKKKKLFSFCLRLFALKFCAKVRKRKWAEMVPQQQDSPTSSGIPLLGSLLVDKNSTTPYSDATQVNFSECQVWLLCVDRHYFFGDKWKMQFIYALQL